MMSEHPPDQYRVPTAAAQAKNTDRGSRFLGYAAPANSEEEALAILAARSRLYHDATHHCWALRVGDPTDPLERSSDAGEPPGTAGRPILDVLRRAGLVEVVLVVTRWFGGTKLGTGGLARAYATCAAETIARLPVKAERSSVLFSVQCGYEIIGLVELFAAKSGGRVESGDYGEAVSLTVRIPALVADGFPERIAEESAGRIRATKIEGRSR